MADAFAINVEAIDRIAAFGVVALLFAMGLELSFERLRRMRRLVFGLGLAQVVVTTLILSAIAWGLGLAPPSALTIGAALTMSSTAIVIPCWPRANGSIPPPAGRVSRFCCSRIWRSRRCSFIVARILGRRRRRAGIGLLHARPRRAGAGALVVLGRLACGLCSISSPKRRARNSSWRRASWWCSAMGCRRGGRPLDGARRLCRRAAAGRNRVPPRNRSDHRAVQGAAARAVLCVGRGRDQSASSSRDPDSSWPRRRPGRSLKAVRSPAWPLFRLPRGSAAEIALLLGPGGEFGFVMVGAAAGGRPRRSPVGDDAGQRGHADDAEFRGWRGWARASVGAARPPTPRRPSRRRKDEEPRVIIVGYGRVGGLIGEMLDLHKMPFIAVDRTRAWRRERRRAASRSITAMPRAGIPAPCGLETARALVVTMDSPRRQRSGGRGGAQRAAGPDAGRPRARRRSRPRALRSRRHGRGARDDRGEFAASEAALVDIGVPMGLVIASIHEKRDEFRKILAAAGAPERPRSTRGPRRG